LDLDDAEIEQKLKDELDEEVDKKFKTQIQVDYDDDYPANEDYLKEDTIKTDKIEQIIENEKKDEEVEEEYSYHDDGTPKGQEAKK
jgi:hypothetical protein